jgi:putative toxin-antitoxin system antitoxin component (TIGR02293 family)
MVAKKKVSAGKSPSGHFVTKKAAARIPQTVVRESISGRFLVKAQRVKKLVELGYSAEEIHNVVAPRRTLDRRKKNDEPLTLAESDRVQRLERILAMANRVFGSEEKARRWLRKPCRALDGAVPIDLLASETGAHIVEEELHAIDYGMFA